VLEGELPQALQRDAELYAGCVSGAIQQADYLQGIRDAGFSDVTVQRTKPIQLPDSLLDQHLNPIEFADFRKGATGIRSITVYGKKG
ncbi:hypothetical protein RZS08_52755, partial [Arthrospira platensis SPKY1]|nr:hypothetical protein [Arthrospira platensis SPKY1]